MKWFKIEIYSCRYPFNLHNAVRRYSYDWGSNVATICFIHKCVITQSRFTAIANINANHHHHTNGTFLRMMWPCDEAGTKRSSVSSAAGVPSSTSHISARSSVALAGFWTCTFSRLRSLNAGRRVQQCVLPTLTYIHTYIHEHFHSGSITVWECGWGWGCSYYL